MKKLAILLLVFATVAGCKTKAKTVVDAVENTVENTVNGVAGAVKSAVNHAGTYFGTVPCADCEGIETTITIDDKGNFTRTIKYLTHRAGNHEYTDNGVVKADVTGTRLTLGEDEFLVGPNTLIMLDSEGNRIEGELADLYILKKKN